MSDMRKRPAPLIGCITFAAVLVGAALVWLLLDPGFRAGQSDPAWAEMPEEEFERRVHAYLLENPDVIIESLQGWEVRLAAAEQTEALAAVAKWADALFRDATSPVGGNPEGDVTLVEFFDYNCPYCRQVAPTMIEAEAADAQLRIVYKEFPILGPNSVLAAAAALAAHRQDRYVAFHQALMQVSGTVDEEAVMAVATKLGLDLDRLEADMESPEIQAAIDRNLALAQVLRISGTPGFVIGEEVLRGATDLETLQALVARAREVP